jgi:hypothetical protein
MSANSLRGGIRRAARRADLLRRAGVTVLPYAWGERATMGAADLAGRLPVELVVDGIEEREDGAA